MPFKCNLLRHYTVGLFLLVCLLPKALDSPPREDDAEDDEAVILEDDEEDDEEDEDALNARRDETGVGRPVGF